MSSGADEGWEAAALHLVSAQAATSNVRINPDDTVNQLLCSIVAKQSQISLNFHKIIALAEPSIQTLESAPRAATVEFCNTFC